MLLPRVGMTKNQTVPAPVSVSLVVTAQTQEVAEGSHKQQHLHPCLQHVHSHVLRGALCPSLILCQRGLPACNLRVFAPSIDYQASSIIGHAVILLRSSVAAADHAASPLSRLAAAAGITVGLLSQPTATAGSAVASCLICSCSGPLAQVAS